VRNPTCTDPAFLDLLTKHGATVVYAEDDEFPKIRHEGSPFAVARLMQSKGDVATGYGKADVDRFAKMTTDWAKKQDVFCFFISGAKERNPAAAMALQEKLGISPATSADADAMAAGKDASSKDKKASQVKPAAKAAAKPAAGKPAAAKAAPARKAPAKKK
jgi:uncharacterized protein YecE (DUF72 family)